MTIIDSWVDRQAFKLLTPADRSDLIDDETSTAAVEALRSIYADAAALVAPRVLARINTIVAAGGADDQLITDGEWESLIGKVTDTLGDSVLDGVIAGAATFAQLPPVATVANAVINTVKGLVNFASQLRSNLEGWIANRVGEGVTGDWGAGAVLDALNKSSPLSQTTADTVASTQLQAANNAGLFASMDAAQPAALRWVTQRDERVRPAHAAVDKDTIPYGERFIVGGYPARFPGDPDLPFHLTVNCRCELAYIEGTEARRVVGSTKAELRAKAAGLSIDGRSTMTKAQLQTAVLKSLCLQGMAGGPDCPDNFGQMNRTALLTVARGEGIVGRHSMTREQLVYSLRQTLGGGDAALTAKGYAPRAEFAKSQKLASYKRGRAPAPSEFASTTIPSPEARRAKRTELFDQFGGDKTGSVPCVHCGLRLGADASAGLAVLVPEPIVPWSQGGSLALENLVPSCPSCFRARGGRGLVSSGAEPDVWHGFVKVDPRPFLNPRTEFTSEGAIKAWDKRGRSADTPNPTLYDLTQSMAAMEAAFTLEGENYKAVVDDVTEFGTLVHSTITNKAGETIGESTRKVRKAPDGTVEVYHASFHLEDDEQGKGIGAAYLRDSVAMYERMGVGQVATAASSTDADNPPRLNGAYTWARLGFRLNRAKNGPQNMAAMMLSTDMPDEDPSWLALSRQVAKGAADMPEILAHPRGKDFLLGNYGSVAWNGVLPVKKPALVAAGAEIVDTSTIDYDEWERCELGTATVDDEPTQSYTLRDGSIAELTREGAIKAWDTIGRKNHDESTSAPGPDDLVDVEGYYGPIQVPAKFVGGINSDPPPSHDIDWNGWKAENDAKVAALVARIKADQQPGNADELRTLGVYQSAFGMFRDINGNLRSGTGSDERTTKNIANLDSLIAKSALSEATTLHRGVQFANAKALKTFMAAVTPGAVLADRAYMSTTTDEATASQFAGHGKRPAMNLRIEAPAGTHFVYLGDEEHELLLPRGTALRIRSVAPGTSVSKFDVVDVVADIIPTGVTDAAAA